MKAITKIRTKTGANTFSDFTPIGAKSNNIVMDDNTSLQQTTDKIKEDLDKKAYQENVYTKEEVNQMIGELPILEIKKVDSLPTTDINTQAIYLVPNTGNGDSQSEEDKLIEYMYIDGKWEVIGDTKVDFSGYYKKTEIDSQMETKQDAATAWNMSNLVISSTQPDAPTSGYKIWIDTNS